MRAQSASWCVGALLCTLSSFLHKRKYYLKYYDAILLHMLNVGKYSYKLVVRVRQALLMLLVALALMALLPVLSRALPAAEPALRTAAYAESSLYSYTPQNAYQVMTSTGIPYMSMTRVRTTADIMDLFTYSDNEDRGHTYLIICPNWEWKDVSEAYTPSLYEFLYAHTSANMIEDGVANWWELWDYESLHTMLLMDASHTDLDEVLRRVLASLKTGDTLVVTNSMAFAGIEPTEEKYSTVMIKDASGKGLLRSSTTRHMGLITTEDGVNALRALIVDPEQRFPADLTIYPFSELMPTKTRLDILTHDACAAQALQQSQPTFVIVFAGLLVLAIILTAVLLFLEMRIRPRILAYLLPACRILWIFELSIPLAAFLMMLQLPTAPDAEIALDYFWFVTMEVSLVCIVIALVFRWSLAYMAILLATVVTLTLDQVFGGPLSAGSYLSYAPIEGVRFYGIGNEGAALLFGAWVMLVSFYLTRRPFTPLAQALRKWLYPVLSLVVICVIALPWLGANFGVIIWGTVGIYVSWRLFNTARLRKREVIAAIGVAGCMALCVLVLDTTFNGESHMGGQIDIFSGQFIIQIFIMFENVARLSFDTLAYSPPMAVVFVALMTFLIVLTVKQPGPYAKFWADHNEFHGAYNALLVSALLMLLVEDSGILMPALLTLYPLSGLMWFICDYHSWHIRDFIRENRTVER